MPFKWFVENDSIQLADEEKGVGRTESMLFSVKECLYLLEFPHSLLTTPLRIMCKMDVRESRNPPILASTVECYLVISSKHAEIKIENHLNDFKMNLL